MTSIRKELVKAVKNRVTSLIYHDDIDKQHEFKKQAIFSNKSFTNDEKLEVIKDLTKLYDIGKVIFNKGTKRICDNCKQECLATSFYELCVRNYLKANF